MRLLGILNQTTLPNLSSSKSTNSSEAMLKKFNPYISKLGETEKNKIINLVKSIVEHGKIIDNEEINAVIASHSVSSLYKTIYLTLKANSRTINRTECLLSERNSITQHLCELQAFIENNISITDGNKPPYLTSDNDIKKAIKMVYRISVGRYPVDEEIAIWLKHFEDGIGFHEFFLAMLESEEANLKPREGIENSLASLNDGQFIQTAYEILLGRGAQAWEIDLWRDAIEKSSKTRSQVIADIFYSAYQNQIALLNSSTHDGLSCLVMGTDSHISIEDWEYKALTLKEEVHSKNEKKPTSHHRFFIHSKPRYLVSAIASLYRGGYFIEQFMENIIGQDGFSDYCELIIVDADSPEDEYKTIKNYISKHKNINYIRKNYRIGIYDAWNVAAKVAHGEYLTNTNLDDLRRNDSFVLQAGILENLSFVDVVYQDLYYTFDPSLSFDEIVEFGVQTTLPVITPHNILAFNSPHNAPMWRKKLHDELGFFETRYRSAGDYEFWLRCISAGKIFYKINDPHVVYYQNPNGLSTRPDTRGLDESNEILKTYARKLVPTEVIMLREDLVDNLNDLTNTTIVEYGDRYNLVQSSLSALAKSKKYKNFE